jgi:hypothetical protein
MCASPGQPYFYSHHQSLTHSLFLFSVLPPPTEGQSADADAGALLRHTCTRGYRRRERSSPGELPPVGSGGADALLPHPGELLPDADSTSELMGAGSGDADGAPSAVADHRAGWRHRPGRAAEFFFVVFLLEVLSFFFDYLCKTFCIKLLGFQNFSVSFFCVIFLSKNFCASYDFAKIFLPKFLKKTFVNQICQKLFCFPKMFLPNFLKLFFAKFSPKTFVHKILPKSMFFNNFLQNFFLIYIFFLMILLKIFCQSFSKNYCESGLPKTFLLS